MKQDLAKNYPINWSDDSVRRFTYRPFCPQWGYLDRHVNDMVYKLPSIFPTSHHANIGVYIVGMGSDKPFSSFMTAAMPDLAFWDHRMVNSSPAGPTKNLTMKAHWTS